MSAPSHAARAVVSAKRATEPTIHTQCCWGHRGRRSARSSSAPGFGFANPQRGLPSHASARRAVVDYIGWFNGTWLHSALGYLTPNEYQATTGTEDLAQVA
jgi:transposase InsO family protein